MPVARDKPSSTGESLPPLHQLMYGLFYPAVLGTALVFLVLRYLGDGSVEVALFDPSMDLGFVAALFFCASFDSAYFWPVNQKPRYTVSAFILDLLEVGLMFACFLSLHLFEEKNPPVPPVLWRAYLYLSVDVLIQVAWRKLVGLDWRYGWKFRAAVAGLFWLGAPFCGTHWWVNPIVTLVFGTIILIYTISDPRYRRSPAIDSSSAEQALPEGCLVTDKEGVARWQKITIEQMGYVLNLTLTFAVATVAYCLSLLRDSAFVPGAMERQCFVIALILLGLSIVVGVGCAMNRLRDFRGSASRARQNEGAPTKEYLRGVGALTWGCLYIHVAAFVLGVAALAITLLHAYGEKLKPLWGR